MSASVEQDDMLPHLTEDIDASILKWLTTYEIPALNLIAIMLARMTWLAKQTDCKEDFIELLKAPPQILEFDEYKKVTH